MEIPTRRQIERKTNLTEIGFRGLKPGTNYRISVRTVLKDGKYSPRTSNSFDTLLDKPVNLISMVQNKTSVRLSWNPVQSRAYSFTLALGPNPKSCGKFSTEIM